MEHKILEFYQITLDTERKFYFVSDDDTNNLSLIIKYIDTNIIDEERIIEIKSLGSGYGKLNKFTLSVS